MAPMPSGSQGSTCTWWLRAEPPEWSFRPDELLGPHLAFAPAILSTSLFNSPSPPHSSARSNTRAMRSTGLAVRELLGAGPAWATSGWLAAFCVAGLRAFLPFFADLLDDFFSVCRWLLTSLAVTLILSSLRASEPL